MTKRRDYGSGSVYQTADGYWRGSVSRGYTESGGKTLVRLSDLDEWFEGLIDA